MLLADHESLSSILGWVSIACWIVVYVPQIVENFRLKSGEGLSVIFVLIWLLGDLFNLGGAHMMGLLPTVIILAVYYTLCDTILLFQIYYYRWLNKNSGGSDTLAPSSTFEPGEESPLLSSTNDGQILPESRSSIRREFTKYAGALLFVFITGVGAWWINEHINKGKAAPGNSDDTLDWRGQVMGWTSAVLYLGARIPQIFKNFKTRCAGLSPFLFLFSITGNTTYALSILAASMDAKYLFKNASWLVGSGMTVFLDVFVLCQFFYYRSVERGYTHTHP